MLKKKWRSIKLTETQLYAEMKKRGIRYKIIRVTKTLPEDYPNPQKDQFVESQKRFMELTQQNRVIFFCRLMKNVLFNIFWH